MLKKIMQKANAGKNQKGFTLIELLAVIVILAILAAIAIPSVVSIIHKQNDKAAAQDAIGIIHAAKLYVADHNVEATSTNKAVIAEATTSGSASGIDTASGWGSYTQKSSGDSDIAGATVTFDGSNYTISDSALSGISDLATSDQSESGLINFNK